MRNSINKSWDANKRQLGLISVTHSPQAQAYKSLAYKGNLESIIDLVNQIRDVSLPIAQRKKYLYEVAQRLSETPATIAKKLDVNL